MQLGDWLTMAHPLMSDLGAPSKNWWERSLMAAEDLYGRWLESTPLECLRLKQQAVEIDPECMRLEQRGISMLLGVTSLGPAMCLRCQSSTASLWCPSLVEEQNEDCC